MNPFGTHRGPTRLLTLAEFKKGKNISVKRLLEAAASGLFPLFVPMPSDRKALRIDKATNDLAIRSEFFTNPHYDDWQPGLLRLSLSTCAMLAVKDKAEATDFPYAVCRDQVRDAPDRKTDAPAESKEPDDLRRTQPMHIVEIPPNREYAPQALDDVKDCWRLFHPDEQDPSASVPLVVTPDMLVARSDYEWQLDHLTKIGTLDARGKSNDKHIKRHAVPRELLLAAAEKIAATNPNACTTFPDWARHIIAIDGNDVLSELNKIKPELKFEWVVRTLREHFEFDGNKIPHRKQSTLGA